MSQLFMYVLATQQGLTLDIQENVVLGRDADSSNGDGTIKIDLTPHRAYALGVSRRHAMLTQQNGEILVLDLASSNGTYLNGSQLVPHQAYQLQENDVLKLGQLEFRVNFNEQAVKTGSSVATSTPVLAPDGEMQLSVGPTGDIKTLPVEAAREFVRLLDQQKKDKKENPS